MNGLDESPALAATLARIRNRLLVFSGKGGVGKSTVAANLALAFARRGLRTGLLDIDLHGPNIPLMFGLDQRGLAAAGNTLQPVVTADGLKVVSMAFLLDDVDRPVIWRGPLKIKVIKQFLEDVDWGELDWLVIDSPPGTGDEPLTVAQFVPGAGAIVVTTPQEVSLLDSRKAVSFARKLDLTLHGLVENMSGLTCPHCGVDIDLFKTGGGERLAREMGVPFLGRVPFDPEVVVSGDAGTPVVSARPESAASRAFVAIAEALIDRARTKGDAEPS